ncbi:MAG: hypothetical protein ACXU82_11385 [Caulobacteraceae bacterium]
MAQSTTHTPAPHAFPYWPMECLLLYHEAMQDFARYTRDMARSTDPMQAARAENDYGMRLWRDAMQAYYDLAVLPMSLAAKAAERAAAQRQAAK